MADVTYTPDRAGWDALATGPELRGVLEAVLAAGQAYAVGISPRSSAEERAYFDRRYGVQDRDTYADSFSTRIEVVTRRGRPRVEGALENTSRQAAAVEYGNAAVRRPAHVLARTAEAMGKL